MLRTPGSAEPGHPDRASVRRNRGGGRAAPEGLCALEAAPEGDERGGVGNGYAVDAAAEAGEWEGGLICWSPRALVLLRGFRKTNAAAPSHRGSFVDEDSVCGDRGEPSVSRASRAAGA